MKNIMHSAINVKLKVLKMLKFMAIDINAIVAMIMIYVKIVNKITMYYTMKKIKVFIIIIILIK